MPSGRRMESQQPEEPAFPRRPGRHLAAHQAAAVGAHETSRAPRRHQRHQLTLHRRRAHQLRADAEARGR